MNYRKKTNKVLKLILKYWDNNNHCDYIGCKDGIPVNIKFPYSNEEVKECLKILIGQDLISARFGDNQIIFFALTSDAKTYLDDIKAEWKKAVLNGIVFPIIASIITAAIVSLLICLGLKT